MATYNSLEQAITGSGRTLYYLGEPLVPETWQRLTKVPEMHEVIGINFQAPIPEDNDTLKEQVKPNLPWADDHFMERVSGIPYNPPPSSSYWPFASRDNAAFKKDSKFSHTYPERFWPGKLQGIRFHSGDFASVIALLREEPNTRQAFLPIWFPEDTGVIHKERVPCTLGYHFIRRGGKLHVTYYIRSCDYYRHFRDDIYMACKLVYHILSALNLEQAWFGIKPGLLRMDIVSLHIFRAELLKLKRELNIQT